MILLFIIPDAPAETKDEKMPSMNLIAAGLWYTDIERGKKKAGFFEMGYGCSRRGKNRKSSNTGFRDVVVREVKKDGLSDKSHPFDHKKAELFHIPAFISEKPIYAV